MSETGIESDAAGSSINNRFFCHSCSTEVDHADDFKCPLCASGFVELLEETGPQQQASLGNSEQNTSQPEPHIHRNVFHSVPLTRHIISNFGLINGANTDPATIIQDVIRISDQLMAPELMSVGNMGDYALSRTGLDAIVSQLLNQMDSSGGAPPLSEPLIESLPFDTIAQEHINENSQCSICWEKFLIDEQVRRLPCSHIYHDDCIKPWLQQRCTCPICRKPVGSTSNTPRDTYGMTDFSLPSPSTSSDSTSSLSSASCYDDFPLMPSEEDDSLSLNSESMRSPTSPSSSPMSAYVLSSSSSISSETTPPVSTTPEVALSVSSSVTDDSVTSDSFDDEMDFFEADFESSNTSESD